MATFREIVYMALDLMKEHSDDAYYTEEHILFLAQKARAFLLEKKYKGSRNAPFQAMSEENRQTVCLDLEPATGLTGGCAGGWLKSTAKVPAVLCSTSLDVHPVSDVLPTHLSYIPVERMPYVGHNRWLKGIIYCARSSDGYLYLHSVNRQFMFLEKVTARGVFANPEEAAGIACDESGNAACTDVLDTVFPLEESLVTSCIELIVNELSGSRYAPEDKQNNAKDDLGEARVTRAAPEKSDDKES